ncbi:C4-dicarboxylate ABC transporter permease [Endozoicomonas sp. OPT23]|uniref:TRAP transporter permease n=1 Tax=Endozoicomonas sp. OPT23 TaxID=2072845 RepID=UPI00129A4710|nr:TRAP transporter permease [Endozoicomonas sp. OPT23]MRI32640.1 C4-dicarboxylate ABC transporter permease [Endozoicomonas sp. OPT23]
MDKLTFEELQEMEEQYDSELQTRKIPKGAETICGFILVLFGIYHFVTAGTGLPADYWHMGIHLSGVLSMIFIYYAARKGRDRVDAQGYARIPVYDLVLAGLSVLASLYIGFTWLGLDLGFLGIHLPEQALRQGAPADLDIVFGTLLVALVLEATRRTLGPVLPIIIMLFASYALFGPYIPVDILRHPGVTWSQFINNIYFPSEGIFGVTLWVVSTIVFHFVLFGVIAQRMGLGQFFIDISTVIAGKYAGGPAKVSVVSSAFFGSISGSAVANTVSTGSLTIPNMKKLGYPGHFAGGVEAAASAGGQITPPIMGAAAFIMAENLQLPYGMIVLAALTPALMHYIGVLTIVHFQAKKLGLKGCAKEDIPYLLEVLKNGWPTLIPLVVLISVLFSGYTPYLAAFSGIAACLAVGLLNPRNRISFQDMYEAFKIGAKYALAVGAACAAVGIVVGVITTTGVAFRLGFLVTGGAQTIGESLVAMTAWLPFELFSIDQATLFVSLVLIALACILMGAGLPTAALYIMLSAVAQPALSALGVPALAAHLFVLYYGVLSEITPPVCTSAYAAGGIANANPFKTGIEAFKLGNAKIMMPFVFVYSPAMLIVLDDYFTWGEYLTTTLSCVLGIFLFGIVITGYALRHLSLLPRLTTFLAAMMLMVPGVESDLYGIALILPVLAHQLFLKRRELPAENNTAPAV